jgi:mono/diheme cytochrome c family protein
MNTDKNIVGKIHAFWTLEGLGKLTAKDIHAFFHSGQTVLQQQAVAAAVARMDEGNAHHWLTECKTLLEMKNKQLAPYLGFMASAAMQYAPKSASGLLLKMALRYKNDPYTTDAVISGLYGHEEEFLTRFQEYDDDTSLVFYQHLEKVIANGKKRRAAIKKKKANGKFARGQKLFTTYCEVCHGADGEGIRSLGAPLNGSPWVTGDKQTLLAIVLHGLTGPIKIGDKVYKKPEISGEMPAFGQNDQLSDEDIAQILSFIRHAWNNDADPVSKEDVQQARKATSEREKPFTMKELQ